MLGDDVVDVRRNVVAAPKDVHHVDVARNVGDAAIDALAHDLGDVRIVDRHRHDLHARLVRVFGNEVRRLVRIGLHAEHGDAMRVADDAPNPVVVVDEMTPPVSLVVTVIRANAKIGASGDGPSGAV